MEIEINKLLKQLKCITWPKNRLYFPFSTENAKSFEPKYIWHFKQMQVCVHANVCVCEWCAVDVYSAHTYGCIVDISLDKESFLFQVVNRFVRMVQKKMWPIQLHWQQRTLKIAFKMIELLGKFSNWISSFPWSISVHVIIDSNWPNFFLTLQLLFVASCNCIGCFVILDGFTKSIWMYAKLDVNKRRGTKVRPSAARWRWRSRSYWKSTNLTYYAKYIDHKFE